MNEPVSKIVLEEIDSENTEDGGPVVAQDLSIFGHVEVAVTVQIGHVDMNIERLLALKQGEVLSLAQAVDEPVTLLIDQKPVARGNLVAVGDNFGVEIIEINQ